MKHICFKTAWNDLLDAFKWILLRFLNMHIPINIIGLDTRY